MRRPTSIPGRTGLGVLVCVGSLVALSCTDPGSSQPDAGSTVSVTVADASETTEATSTAEPMIDPGRPWEGPERSPNRFLSTGPAPMMHDDPGSSDATSHPGPGVGPVDISTIHLDALCPAILIGSDQHLLALCTGFDLVPIVHLLDPGGRPMASLPLEIGNLFAGVYGYLDASDRLVMVDGSNDVLRIARVGTGPDVNLEVVERTPLDAALGTEAVTSVTPGYDGRVWFATDGGTVGAVDTDSGVIGTLRLVGPNGADERVANSISASPQGVAVATDHALYLVTIDEGGATPNPTPTVRWRRPYDRGRARKPGQLSHGTGSSPTFFGPVTGHEYLAIVDNAEPEVHLVVVSVTDHGGHAAGDVVCSPVVFEGGGPGSENSPVGSGRTVVVASTYGYAYPAVPPVAGPAVPDTAPIAGGLTRVDIGADGSSCEVVWTNQLRSAAVPKLSPAEGHLWTVLRRPFGDPAQGADWFDSAVLSVETGEVLASHPLPPDTGDPLQLAGSVGSDGVLFQGTLGPILRIAPAAARPTAGPTTAPTPDDQGDS